MLLLQIKIPNIDYKRKIHFIFFFMNTKTISNKVLINS